MENFVRFYQKVCMRRCSLAARVLYRGQGKDKYELVVLEIGHEKKLNC
jgi:hypothetical protein